MTKLKKIWKICWKLGVALLLLSLVLYLAIQLPSVQNFLKGRLVTYLENKLDTEVQIESIRLRLPESIVLSNLYLEDQQTDTLLYLKELAINFKLNKLLQKRIQFDQLILEDAYLKLNGDSTGNTNYDFIIKAFSSQEVTEKPSSPPSWDLTFNDARLRLKNIDFYFLDEEAQIKLNTKAGNWLGHIQEIDLFENIYHLHHLELNNSFVSIEIGDNETEEAVDSTSKIPLYDFVVHQIDLNQTQVNLALTDLHIQSTVEKVTSLQNALQLESDKLNIQIPDFTLAQGDFQYDIPSAPVISQGFDYNHFSLTDISLDIDDFDYQNLHINALLQKASANLNKSTVLQQLQSQFQFSPEELLLSAINLKVNNSDLLSEKVHLQYPFVSDKSLPLDSMHLDFEVDAKALQIADIAFFAPMVDSLDFIKNNSNRSLRAKAKGKGSFAQMQVEYFDIQSWNTNLNASGALQNILYPNELSFQLEVHRLNTTKEGITEWLPQDILPAYIELPDQVNLTGNIGGNLQNINTKIDGQTTRLNDSIPSKILATTTIQNALGPDSLYFDIQLDTFFTNRANLLAYLPRDSIPEYVTLPESLLLTGTTKGTLSNLQSDLQLFASRDGKTSQLSANGSIIDLLSLDSATFDLQLESISIERNEIQAYLPDSLLPEYFKLPVINKLNGIIKGRMDNFTTKVDFESNTGKWVVNATTEPDQSYKLDMGVQDFVLEEFFRNRYLDTLVGVSFAPWTINMKLEGRGYNLAEESKAELFMQIRKAEDVGVKGLIIEGILDDQYLYAIARSNEPELQLHSELALDYSESIPETELLVQLDKIDFQKLRLTDSLIQVSGSMNMQLNGYTMDTLFGGAKIKNLVLQYNEKSERVDSIATHINFDNGNNYLDVSSDLFNAELKGSFEYPRVVQALQQRILSFWPDYPDTLVGQTSDQFNFQLGLHRPEVLTIGIIPGLEELAPFQFSAKFDNAQSLLQAKSNIIYLTWYGTQVDNLAFNYDATEEQRDYSFQLQRVNYLDFLTVDNVEAYGHFEQNRWTTNFLVYDNNQRKRFDLKSFIQVHNNESFSLYLLPEQVLNYQKWSVSENNSLNLNKKKLTAGSWRFSRGKEAIELISLHEDHLEIRFDEFNLQLLSDIVQPGQEFVGGQLNGYLNIQEALSEARFNAKFSINNFSVMKAMLGDLQLTANNFDPNRLKTELAIKGNGNDIQFFGNYNVNNKIEVFDYDLKLNTVNLASVEPLSLGYLEKMQGLLKGDLAISGNVDQPALVGEIHFENTSFDVEMLKTNLRLGDEVIFFDANAIEFQNLKIFDARDNQGTVSAYLLTTNYRDFYLDTRVNAKDFQVLNTTEEDNDLYYGKLFVDGDVHLTGRLLQPIVDVTAQPKIDSEITYVYSAASNNLESHEGIVEFINPNEEISRPRAQQSLFLGSEDLNMTLKVKSAIDDKLKVRVITDPITGDYFEGKAKGDLNFTQYPNGKMELIGELEVIEGDYLLTYQDIIRRPFELEPGSTINWRGDPYNPTLNLKVKYKVRTSPYPIMASQQNNNDGTGTNRQTIAKQVFLVTLEVTGTANKTQIQTLIEYPNTEGNSQNAEVESAIQRINSDQSQQNTQAFALILFNGFIAQNINGTGSDWQITNLTGNVNTLISQQLNNLANRYIQFVDIDFGLDTYDQVQENGNGNTRRSDLRVSVSKRFLNDRLAISIDGVATTESGQEESASQAYLDNLTVEYSLTPDGRFRVKLYNQRDFDDFVGGTGIKVGGALIFSKDFNRIKLFGK